MSQAVAGTVVLKPTPRLIGAVLVVLWVTTGANFLGFRIALESLPPMLMVSLRLFVAGLMLLPIVWFRGEFVVPPWRQLQSILTSSILLLVIGQGAVVWAVQFLPAGTVRCSAPRSPCG